MWIPPAIKSDRTEYYEMLICYVGDLSGIYAHPMKTIDGMKQVFKFKDKKAESPEMYLGTSLQNVNTADGTKCWAMSSDKYVKAAVINVEESLERNNFSLPSKCDNPMAPSYHSAEDTTQELNAAGLQTYQELIGILIWVVGIGRIDLLMEVPLLSSHLLLPRVGHLKAVYRVFRYLKQVPESRISLDPQKPTISEDCFQIFDWEDFYSDAEEMSH